jgi:hypothetical protein
MRRRKLLGALAGLAVVVAAGVIVMWPRAERVTRANYDRIQIGMSRAEVEAILGSPGDYTTVDRERTGDREGRRSIGELSDLLDSLRGHREHWDGDLVTIGVRFDEAGNLTNAGCEPYRPINHGPIGNLLWRLTRQWHRWFPE